MFGCDGCYNVLALFRFERAGGVDEAAAGGEALEGSGEDGALAFGLASELFGLETEADLGVAGEGAGAGAGDVAEDEVEEVVVSEGRGVGDCTLNVACVGVAAQPCLEVGETPGAYVGREDVSAGEAAGEDEGLASGGGTAIPDFFGVGFGRDCEFGYEAGAVVHVGKVLCGINAEHCAFGWFPLGGFADFEGGFASVGVGPALYEPAGMGEALCKGCYRLVDAGPGFLGGGHLAQDGVDHAGGVGFACGSAEFDALAEGGVGGDAVEVQELEGSEAEGDGYWFCKALLGALEEGADAGVDCDLPAEDSHNQRGGEVAVFGRQSIDPGGVEEFVAVALVLADEREDFEGGQAGRGDFFE